MSVNGNKLAPNAFENRLKFTFLNKLQIAVMSVTIFPIRLALAVICIGLVCLFCFIATVTLPNVATRPTYGWRRKLQVVIRGLLRAMFFFSSIHRIKVKGRQNLENGREPDIVIGAPHTTFFDPIMMFAFQQLPTAISRIENLELPILGNVTKYFMPISVVRDNPNSRKNTIAEIKSRLESRVRYMKNLEAGKATENDPDAMNWPTLYSFPEGTVGNGKHLLKFKYGAFIPGHPVQPVYLRYHNPMHTTTWTWIGASVFKILWLTLCQFNTTTVITILPLYHPSSEEKQDPKLFANNVRALLSQDLGVGRAEVDIYDTDLYVYLSKLSLRPLNSVLLLSRLLRKTQFKDCFHVLGFVEKNFLNIPRGMVQEWKENPFMNLTQFKRYLGQLEYVGQTFSGVGDSVVQTSCGGNVNVSASSGVAGLAVSAVGGCNWGVGSSVGGEGGGGSSGSEGGVSIDASNNREESNEVDRSGEEVAIHSGSSDSDCVVGGREEGMDGGVSLADKLEVEDVFDACLEEGENSLDVRKFLLWMCLCSEPEETEYLVRLAFKLYNRSTERMALKEDEMKNVLEVLFQCSRTEVEDILKELFHFSNELTFGYFRAYCLNEGSRTFKKYHQIFNRFFKTKTQLLLMQSGPERAW